MLIRCLLLWLSIATTARSAGEPKCPDIAKTMFAEAECGDKMYCEPPKPSTDGKSFSCAADTIFEGRASKNSSWVPIEDVKCELSSNSYFITAKTKGGDAKKFDKIVQFRCSAPVCAVDTEAAAKTFCPTGDECVKANVDKSKLSCPETHALEAKTANGKWIELLDNRCIGSKLTSSAHEPIEVYGCRKLRGCHLDKYKGKSCGLKEKCTVPKDSILPCGGGSAEFQASFTDDVSWQKIQTAKCIDNRRLAMNDNTQIKEIPLALRCVQDAVCEIDITKIYDGSACTKDVFDLEECFEPEKEALKTTFKCPGNGVSLMEMHQKDGDPWTLARDIDCYNDILVDRVTEEKIIGKFRCRGKRNNDMTNYYVKTDCEDKKVCEMPIKVNLSETAYHCNINNYPWKFEAKFIKNWVEIQSAEFRNDVFVTKNTTGADKPGIPIQFRCVRDATCKIDPETKFNSETCPVKDKDNCESPKLDDTEKKIECSSGKVIEYQTNKAEAWRELTELGCYNDVLEPKRDTDKVAAAKVVNLRCRAPRKCDIGKYYDADIPDCKTKLICEKPTVDTANQLYTCNANYDILYQVLGYTGEVAEKWKKIDQLKCQNDRFMLGENKADHFVDTLKDIPVALMCAIDKKCDLQHFTSDDDCNEATEVCAKPIAGPSTPESSYNLTCADPIMALRVKDDLDGAWAMVKWITCNGEGFTVYREDNEKFDKFALRIQCVKLATTTCVNPCANRTGCQADVKFFEPAAWDEPARLHCAQDKKIFTIGNQDEGMLYKEPLTCTGKKENGMDVWANREGDGNGKCLDAACMKDKAIACIDKLFCSDKSPIQSRCDRHANDCNMVYINNYGNITCKSESQMVLKLPVSGKKLDGTLLRCDERTGEWNYTLMDGTVMKGLPKEAGAEETPNIYCQQKGCDPQWLEKLFPVQNQSICLENDGWCSRPTLVKDSKRIYECPAGHVTYFWDDAGQEWYEEPEHTGKFMCCQSEITQLVDYSGGVKADEYSCFGMAEPLEHQRPAVKCVRKPTCFEKNPLRSNCEGKADCDTRVFNDSSEQYTCDAKYYWHVNGEKHSDQFLSSISCDTSSSEWVGNGESSVEAKFESSSNIVCMKTAGSTLIPLTGLALILLAAFQ